MPLFVKGNSPPDLPYKRHPTLQGTRVVPFAFPTSPPDFHSLYLQWEACLPCSLYRATLLKSAELARDLGSVNSPSRTTRES